MRIVYPCYFVQDANLAVRAAESAVARNGVVC